MSVARIGWTSVALIALVACATQPDRGYQAARAGIFSDATPFLAQRIKVTGYLQYEFEDRNLYPPSGEDKEKQEELCLPVLIERDNKDLLAQASHLSGQVVTLYGTVLNPMPNNLKPLGMCKSVGIAVDFIEPSRSLK